MCCDIKKSQTLSNRSVKQLTAKETLNIGIALWERNALIIDLVNQPQQAEQHALLVGNPAPPNLIL